MLPVAILDFGTNTFNLLIARKAGNSFDTIFSGKQAVKLGHGGINNNIITDEAMERGIAAIAKHMEVIKKHSATEIHAYATSAFRNAANGKEFSRLIKNKFGFQTNIIDGEEEAQLIYEGIRASVSFDENNDMILDIGGGSNEFIICNRNGIHWKRSFELGMARIIDKFTLSDPISADEIAELESYYGTHLDLLTDQVAEHKPLSLIGASGTFDTIAAIAREQFGAMETSESFLKISLDQYAKIHRMLLNSTMEERKTMPGMEPVRIEMIIPATIFINFVVEKYGLNSITQSGYALKEGVMSRIIKK